jgi:YbbR domain-containing protein
MLRDKLSKISTKVFYIVFSLLVSIALWMYVELTENEQQQREVPGIEIVRLNADVLRDRGLLITSVTPETITLTFEGSRSDISRLTTPGAVTVEIDLANIVSAGWAQLSYVEVFPAGVNRNDVSILERSVGRVTLLVDREEARQIPVRVAYTGGTAMENLSAEPVEFDPQMITVWGPGEVISRISYVRVPILRENLASTITEDFEFLLYGEDDEELDAALRESVTFSQETIRVTIPIREIKEIPLTVELSHFAGTSAQNVSVTIDPKTIKVSGDPDTIRDLNNIMLGTIDLSRFGLTTTLPYSIIVPNHITNISGEAEAMVLVEILGLEIAYRSTSNLQVINTPPGFRAEILTQSLDVRIRGAGEDLANVTPANIRVVADIRDMGPGTARIAAKVNIDGIDADIDAVGEYLITVSIIRE